MARFIISGTGRSGSTYCQAILKICGVRVAHQTVFTFETVKKGFWNWDSWAGEASFMAVPLLDQVKKKEPETKIILVKRDKDKVMQSWLKSGVFHQGWEDIYPDWVWVFKKYLPSILEANDPYEMAELYYDSWNTIAEPYADKVYDLETLDNEDLFRTVGWLHAYDSVLVDGVRKDINRHD